MSLLHTAYIIVPYVMDGLAQTSEDLTPVGRPVPRRTGSSRRGRGCEKGPLARCGWVGRPVRPVVMPPRKRGNRAVCDGVVGPGGHCAQSDRKTAPCDLTAVWALKRKQTKRKELQTQRADGEGPEAGEGAGEWEDGQKAQTFRYKMPRSRGCHRSRVTG